MSKTKLILASLALAFVAGCGDDGGSPAIKDAPPKDAAPIVDAGPPDASCFENPDMNDYRQIINACTTATKIYKDSHPPHTLPDGGLPPLGSTL